MPGTRDPVLDKRGKLVPEHRLRKNEQGNLKKPKNTRLDDAVKPEHIFTEGETWVCEKALDSSAVARSHCCSYCISMECATFRK